VATMQNDEAIDDVALFARAMLRVHRERRARTGRPISAISA
jgi:hypothetical protein